MLYDFTCVNDVKLSARNRRTVLQELPIYGDAQKGASNRTVVRNLHANRFTTITTPPEIKREAKTASDVEKSALPGSLVRKNWPNGFPYTGKAFDVNAPKIITLLT